jgi:UDPglucose 6-dehydrogenase
MNITIVGTGYVGLVTGTCLADLGNSVCCLDIDPAKIATLNSGGVPIHEPGLGALIQSNVEAGRLRFTTDVADAVAFGDVQFIAVGTPPDEDGSADLQYVLAAARNIGRHMTGFKVVVDKSTVPVGTADKVRAAIQAELGARGVSEHTGFSVVSNPEFLKEGAAVDDFMRPDRIVLGVDATTPEGQRALALMRQLYLPFNRNHERTRVMDVRSAEFTKYAANAMLATRISFMNELANLADKVGADIELVRQGIGSDPRIGYSFLYAGTGYGGSCFPKDVQALVRTAGEHGQRLRVLEAVEAVNHEQKHIIVNKILARYGHDLSGRHFALWGLAFKPNTDDMRDAPSRVLIQALLRAGASIHAHDPVATAEARRVVALDLMDAPHCLERIRFADKPLEALPGADALVIMTEWKAYRSPNLTAHPRHRRRRLPRQPPLRPPAGPGPRRALRRQLLHRHQGQRRPPARPPALRADAPRRHLPAVCRGRPDLQPGLPGLAPSTTSTTRCRPPRPACTAPSTCSAWPSACAPGSSRRRPRGLRRPRRAPAARSLLGQRQPHRHPQLLRRRQALRRNPVLRLPPPARAADQGGAHLQHLRPAHAPQRRPRRQQLHRAGAAGAGRRPADPQLLTRATSRLPGLMDWAEVTGPIRPANSPSASWLSSSSNSIPCPYRRGNLRASRPTSTHHEQRLSARYQCVVRVDAQQTGHCRA